MIAVVASLIAVAGTLLGSVSTYWFQQRASQRTEAAARQERLRQDRLAACSEFGAAVTDSRRAVIAVWFRRQRRNQQGDDRDHASDEYHRAYAEADRLGAAAQGAMFRMLLVLDDPALRALAEGAIQQTRDIYTAVDLAEVKTMDATFETHMSTFVSAAARLLQTS